MIPAIDLRKQSLPGDSCNFTTKKGSFRWMFLLQCIKYNICDNKGFHTRFPKRVLVFTHEKILNERKISVLCVPCACRELAFNNVTYNFFNNLYSRISKKLSRSESYTKSMAISLELPYTSNINKLFMDYFLNPSEEPFLNDLPNPYYVLLLRNKKIINDNKILPLLKLFFTGVQPETKPLFEEYKQYTLIKFTDEILDNPRFGRDLEEAASIRADSSEEQSIDISIEQSTFEAAPSMIAMDTEEQEQDNLTLDCLLEEVSPIKFSDYGLHPKYQEPLPEMESPNYISSVWQSIIYHPS